ncbi:MAG: leucyl aminopeptidase family protein, partial [Planctomycetes bacterium]|nr:leucyl aminopeptidase family protein [Planctomycetota bacterium]
MKFRYPSKLSGMLAGVRHLLVVAPERILQDPPAGLGAALGQARTTRVRTLAAELRAGDLGDVATTLTGGEPARLSVGALPNRVSRYNCAARPESVQRVVSAARLTPDHKNAILLVVDDPLHALPVLLAVGRAFPLFSRKSGAGKVGTISVCVVDVAGNPCTIDPTTRATVDASRQAARLVDAPPTELDPQALAKEARKMLRGIAGVRCREISGPALLQNGLAGIHAVGRTAVAAPRMLIARYTPARSRRGQRKIALVGKGVTYDTGGLSIKGKTAMPTMKADMGGAAAALAAFSVLAGARIPAPLSLVLCLAENAVGPTSYKPDDILTLHSGKTVEVNNTDAEG